MSEDEVVQTLLASTDTRQYGEQRIDEIIRQNVNLSQELEI